MSDSQSFIHSLTRCEVKSSQVNGKAHPSNSFYVKYIKFTSSSMQNITELHRAEQSTPERTIIFTSPETSIEENQPVM